MKEKYSDRIPVIVEKAPGRLVTPLLLPAFCSLFKQSIFALLLIHRSFLATRDSLARTRAFHLMI